MDLIQQILQYLQPASDIAFAILAVIGGLKVVARYTPWKGDDAFLEKIEKPIQYIANLLRRK